MAQHIHKLTKMLTETRIENDRPLQNIVMPLVPAEIDNLLHEQLPYSWMSSIAALFKEVSDASPYRTWATDRSALTVRRILHEEPCCRRQGKLSTPGGPLMARARGGVQGHIQGPVPPSQATASVAERTGIGRGTAQTCSRPDTSSRPPREIGWQLDHTSGICQVRRRGRVDGAGNGIGRHRPAQES